MLRLSLASLAPSAAAPPCLCCFQDCEKGSFCGGGKYTGPGVCHSLLAAAAAAAVLPLKPSPRRPKPDKQAPIPKQQPNKQVHTLCKQAIKPAALFGTTAAVADSNLTSSSGF